MSPPSFDMERARQEVLQTWMQAEVKSSSGGDGGGCQIHARYCCFTYDDVLRAYNDPKASWHWLDRELLSNVAGETGAVHVYQGALAASAWVQSLPFTALEFCHEHQCTEAGHLALFTSLVPTHKYTRLLPLWKVAGWLVGFLPTALAGSQGLYVTVEAIESFVEEHFQDQIQPLMKQIKEDGGNGEGNGVNGGNHSPPKKKSQTQDKVEEMTTLTTTPELLKILKHCCEDEVHHKEEAMVKLLHHEDSSSSPAFLESLWWAIPCALGKCHGSRSCS